MSRFFKIFGLENLENGTAIAMAYRALFAEGGS